MADKAVKEAAAPAAVETNEAAGKAETATPYMQEEERESHGIGINVERYTVLLIVSTGVIIAAVAAWFYFYG
ncbi:MAG TPA: hypothetical protein VMU42_11975 [Candidatus Sulfotelmatobacter sp.]|nr:hypothetical protein [Candidatus Sulfotelmatobacter sp.]